MLDFSFLVWLLARLISFEPTRQPSTANRQPVVFARDIQPIFEKRCQPCHFPGGKMYARLPFDKPETIHKLGEKLFTRIKAEDERASIRTFLAQK